MSTLLAEQTTNTTGLNYYSNSARSCQTFTMPSGYDTVEYINLYIKNGGSYGGTFYVYLYATSGGLPTGSALASTSISGGSISTSWGWVTFDIANITVTPGAKYAIVTYPNGSSSLSNGVYIGHADGSGYSGGDSFYSLNSGSSWTSLSGDWTFQVYGTIGVVIPTVSTTTPASITSSGATLGGNVTSAGGGTVTARGICYNTTGSPVRNVDATVNIGSGTGTFSQAVTGLSPNVTYYVRAWATNSAGDAYGSALSFATLSTTPVVVSGSSTNIASTTATCSGNVTSSGGETVTERGIVYGTSINPTTAGSKVTSGTGTGSFTANLTGLSSGTTYHWRAYAININGTVYGTDYTFTTKNIITEWGQSFTTISAGVVNKVSLYLKEILASSSIATVQIYSDNAGSPGTLLSSATKTVTGTNYAWYDFVFNQTVTATTKYWIVLDSPYIVGTRYLYWGYDTSGTYEDTKYSVDNATNWSSAIMGCATFAINIQPSLTVNYDVTVDYKKRYL